MATQAILVNTKNFTDRPKDPPPIEVPLAEMREYCKRNGYEQVANIDAPHEFLFQRDTPLSKLIIEMAKSSAPIVLVTIGKTNERVEGDQIAPEMKGLLENNELRIEHIEHPCISPPKLGTTRIWRYLSLPKFLDLLQTNCLHFTRVDDLRKFDPSEGVSSTLAHQRYLQFVRTNVSASPIPELTLEQFLQLNESSEIDDKLSKVHFVNCWHISDHENYAMWKIYSEPFGVCIESTYEKLKNCFADDTWDYYSRRNKIYIGRVNYIDSETEFIDRSNTFWTYLSKRREYRYENELRCIVHDWKEPKCIRPKIDVSSLIQSIKLNPEAPDWYHSTVDDICLKYGLLNKAPVRSALSQNF